MPAFLNIIHDFEKVAFFLAPPNLSTRVKYTTDHPCVDQSNTFDTLTNLFQGLSSQPSPSKAKAWLGGH